MILGSTPLDLFKLYVDDLKARYHEDKKLIKEILKEKKAEIEINTTYEEFVELVNSDKRSSQVSDPANMKLTYQSFMEKAEQREKERLKEEQKRVKKLESAFRSLLKKHEVNEATKFEDIRTRISSEEAYVNINDDKECERMFNDYLTHLQEACLHHVKKKKDKEREREREREKKRSSAAKRSRSNSIEEGEEEPGAGLNDDDYADEKLDESRGGADEHKSGKKHKKSKKKKRVKSVCFFK